MMLPELGLRQDLEPVDGLSGGFTIPGNSDKIARLFWVTPGQESVTLFAAEELYAKLATNHDIKVAEHDYAVVGKGVVASLVEHVDGVSFDPRNILSPQVHYPELAKEQRQKVDALFRAQLEFIWDSVAQGTGLPYDIYGIDNYVLPANGSMTLVDLDPPDLIQIRFRPAGIERLHNQCFVASQFLDAVSEGVTVNDPAFQTWRNHGARLVDHVFKANGFSPSAIKSREITDISLGLISTTKGAEDSEDLSEAIDTIVAQVVAEQ